MQIYIEHIILFKSVLQVGPNAPLKSNGHGLVHWRLPVEGIVKITSDVAVHVQVNVYKIRIEHRKLQPLEFTN